MSRRDESGKQRRQLWAVCGGLLLITLAAYWPALSCDFVNYDDLGYVTENSHVQGGLSMATLGWAFTTGDQSNWHPLTWLSHALDCQLYGLKPSGHHLTNLLFHLANTLLLFVVLRRLTGATWRSAFVAALFAWHPAHVESVAWVSERKDVLSAFFWMLTMLAYAKYGEESRGQVSKSKVFYGLALLCFALGLMCKPMLVTLPFVLLLLDYWPLGRIYNLRYKIDESKDLKAAPPIPSASRKAQIVVYRKLIGEKIPFFVLAVISSVVTYEVQQKGGAVSTSLTVGARMANALVSYLRYVGKLFWPENLSVLYPHPGTWPLGLVIGAGVFVAGVSAGAICLRRQKPWLLVGWFWFLGTLVPVIGLVQVGVQSMADRYTYVPAIGVFMMVAWGVPEVLGRFAQPRWLLGTAGGIALSGCFVITSLQLDHWKDSEALFRRAVEVTKNNYLACNNLGFFLSNHGKVDEAMAYYQKSLEINPNYEDAQNNLGHALAQKGRLDEAILHYEMALKIKPGLAEAHNNLGNALGDQGKLDEAIGHYLAALQIDPENENALNNLGIARAMQGKSDEASKLLTEAIRLKPSDASAHGNLGTLLASQNKLDEAAKQFQIALQLSPDDAKSHNNLGNVLSQLGRSGEAKAQYMAALKLNAENPEANYNLGLVLLREGSREEATRHFMEALRLRPNYPDAQRQLTALTHPQGR
ncbi:MAG TPA: tetratricopeptide repeat protein [Verrucomicrobiae bacterium]|nr:tetratricopeptide repeat protein [Verrucomicrobiae bacterium]